VTDTLHIAYVAPRLPVLSETFVTGEIIGLSAKGHTIIPVSVRKPAALEDKTLRDIATAAIIVYAFRTLLAIPIALISRPGILFLILRAIWTADIRTLGGRMKFAFQAMMGAGLGFRLSRRKIDHVHAHFAHVPSTIALFCAAWLKRPFSFTGHANDIFVNRSALRFKLERARFVAAISSWHRDFYRAIVADVNAPIIRCGVSIPDARPVVQTASPILVVSRLVPKKGIDTLIRAYAMCSDIKAELYIYGDGPERAALEAMCVALNIAQTVTFFGSRPHSDCLEAFKNAALFVLPCRVDTNGDMDGIPVVLMEAMAAGCPVIAGDIPTLTDLITGENGIRIDCANPDLLAHEMAALMADAPRRQQLGAAARATIIAEFSQQVNIDRIEAAFLAARLPLTRRPV
jgi:colanic acid/amylovoran biosynthesis glycosyltransferase